jgi:hypothetical protein
VANELRRGSKSISQRVLRVWTRQDLQTFKKRLVALEPKVAQDGMVLSEAQLAAMDKSEAPEAEGEIQTEHPEYLGAQDTFYVAIPRPLPRHAALSLYEPASGPRSVRTRDGRSPAACR